MMEVLQNHSQIAAARQQLVSMGASSLEPGWRKLLRRFRLLNGVDLGDQIKSWDVLATLEFLEKNLSRSDPVLDIGSFASEILVALHKRGFNCLTGTDLNTDLKKMPFADRIRYEIADFMHTPFEDEVFRAITSISVIEHGFNGEALLQEMSRLLQPGGYFVASFDYWPEKIDTTGVQYFDMDWLIFSQEDVAEFVRLAANYGMEPVGDMRYAAGQRIIESAGKAYTFGWLVLKKSG